jgi:YVTN family beta-propeller protein
VSVIDVNTATIRTTINLNVNIANVPPLTTVPQPRGVAVLTFGDPVTRVYVSDQANNVVHVIDGGTNSVITRIPVGQQPDGISACLNCTGAAIAIVAVANTGSNTVSVISGFANQVSNTIPVGTRPAGITLRRNTFYGYVTNSGSTGTTGTSIIDMRTRTVVGNLFSGLGQGAFRVTAKDTTCTNTATSSTVPCNEVYVGYQTTSNVQIFRVEQNPTAGQLAFVDNTLLTTIGTPPTGNIGQVPNELDIVQDSRRVYVANGNSTVANPANNSVSIIEGRVPILPPPNIR